MILVIYTIHIGSHTEKAIFEGKECSRIRKNWNTGLDLTTKYTEKILEKAKLRKRNKSHYFYAHKTLTLGMRERERENASM